jgi:hypothetical protein
MKVFDVLGIAFATPDRWNPGGADGSNARAGAH